MKSDSVGFHLTLHYQVFYEMGILDPGHWHNIGSSNPHQLSARRCLFVLPHGGN